ncbi:MAG: peptidoglycan-binding protein [Thermaerobacter sp.]|nr:peptidoglycan-binding protein [Thermaerobacter sp.]
MAVFEGDLSFFAFGSRLLRLRQPNMRGTDVKVLQDLYDQLVRITNPPLGPVGPEIDVDGIFGPETDSAVRNIQSYFGLAVDGIAGPQTYLVLGQAVGPNVTYGGPGFGSRNLSEGSTGGDVTVLQNRLNCFRYSQVLAGPANGIYGFSTTGAVSDFQVDAIRNGDAGVPISGEVGFETFDALWIYTYAGGRNLALGSRGLDVAWVQLFLSSKTSSLNRAYYTGRVDGYFGTLTQNAVRLWQSDNGIPLTGVVGPLTYFSIGFNNPNAAPAPAPLPPEPRPLAIPCCVVLRKTPVVPPSAPDAVGAALTSVQAGRQAVSVLAVGLPAPSTFGNFDSYEGLVTIPIIGAFGFGLVPTTSPFQPLTWAGSVDLIQPELTVQATVSVRPANSETGTSGPDVLLGTLSGCIG